MNILFYENLVNPEKGGIQRVTHSLAKEFIRRQEKCFVVHSEQDDFKDESAFTADLYYNGNKKTLESFIAKYKIDVVINQLARDTDAVKMFRELQQKYSFKVVSCLHTSPNCTAESCRYFNLQYPKDTLRAVLKRLILCFNRIDIKQMKYAYDNSDKFILLTPRFIEQTKELLGVDGSRLMAIYNPASYDKVNSACKKEKMFLVVSRINENQKKISKVLDMWRLVQHKLPEWHLYIVGEGNRLPTYIKRAKALQLERLHFEGRQDPRPYYERASVFLMTSIFEGFCMTLLEAQQHGVVPVVFDTTPCFRDIVESGKDGFLIERNDDKGYAEAMLNLAQDDELRRRMAQNALVSVQRFKIDNTIEQWYKLFELL